MTHRKFQVGDVVKVTRVNRVAPPAKYFQRLGCLGKIIEIRPEYPYPYCICGLTSARRKVDWFVANELALIRRAK